MGLSLINIIHFGHPPFLETPKYLAISALSSYKVTSHLGDQTWSKTAHIFVGEAAGAQSPSNLASNPSREALPFERTEMEGKSYRNMVNHEAIMVNWVISFWNFMNMLNSVQTRAVTMIWWSCFESRVSIKWRKTYKQLAYRIGHENMCMSVIYWFHLDRPTTIVQTTMQFASCP